MASVYKFIIGVGMIIMLSLLWIGLNEPFGQPGGLVDAFNAVTTDSGVINYNETGRQIFYYALLFFIIIIAIWIFKEDREQVFIQ